MTIKQIFLISRIYLKWFRPGKCKLCNKWTWFIMRSENAHESCWLKEKLGISIERVERAR